MIYGAVKMTSNMPKTCHQPLCEHSVPYFWPLAAAIELGQEGLKLFESNFKFLAEAETFAAAIAPEWTTPNRIILDMDTMRLRDFTAAAAGANQLPVLVDAPYAGHSATIADYAKGQSLVETLPSCGLERLLVTDWKAATPQMKDFDIDKYLAEINAAVDDLGGHVVLVGLCQGGWMSAMLAHRYARGRRSAEADGGISSRVFVQPDGRGGRRVDAGSDDAGRLEEHAPRRTIPG
jgi:poly(3-hydroxybutyrate) depolymerase